MNCDKNVHFPRLEYEELGASNVKQWCAQLIRHAPQFNPAAGSNILYVVGQKSERNPFGHFNWPQLSNCWDGEPSAGITLPEWRWAQPNLWNGYIRQLHCVKKIKWATIWITHLIWEFTWLKFKLRPVLH